MTHEEHDRLERRPPAEPMEVYRPESLVCPDCGHFPLVVSDYDGGDPPVYEPYDYYECLECGYRTDE